jgi:hypothetical protein
MLSRGRARRDGIPSLTAVARTSAIRGLLGRRPTGRQVEAARSHARGRRARGLQPRTGNHLARSPLAREGNRGDARFMPSGVTDSRASGDPRLTLRSRSLLGPKYYVNGDQPHLTAPIRPGNRPAVRGRTGPLRYSRAPLSGSLRLPTDQAPWRLTTAIRVKAMIFRSSQNEMFRM